MEHPVQVAWWQKLLLALAAVSIAFIFGLAVMVLRDFIYYPDFQWGNAGEEQIVGYFGIFGGLIVLLTYVCFVAPLVLLWPTQSQKKHWYAMLLVSLLWLPPAMAVVGNARPIDKLHDLLHPFHPDLSWFMEPFAPVACGLYLLFLRRRTKGSKDM